MCTCLLLLLRVAIVPPKLLDYRNSIKVAIMNELLFRDISLIPVSNPN